MSRIRLLPDHVANQIAAGEVVERPASVAKELVENAIDANAKRITIDVEAGGRRLLRVSDDGHGMVRDDAILAFERHATSKIAKSEDLNSISTLGFRGEALASIASVARVELVSSTGDTAAGTRVVIEGGKMRDVKDAAHPRGTTISVRDLFFNVPARRKFLRSEATESFHLTNLVTHYALAHPEIAFTLTNSGREVLRAAPATDLRERAYQIFGAEFLDNLLTVSGGNSAVAAVSGFVSAPRDRRTSRDAQYLFVNGRFVRDRLVGRALSEGYRSILPHGVYPAALLFIELPLEEVDVNVHPAKTEVRFRRAAAVADSVREAVRDALASAGYVRPERLDVQTEDVTEINHVAVASAGSDGGSPASQSRIEFTHPDDDEPVSFRHENNFTDFFAGEEQTIPFSWPPKENQPGTNPVSSEGTEPPGHRSPPSEGVPPGQEVGLAPASSVQNHQPGIESAPLPQGQEGRLAPASSVQNHQPGIESAPLPPGQEGRLAPASSVQNHQPGIESAPLPQGSEGGLAPAPDSQKRATLRDLDAIMRETAAAQPVSTEPTIEILQTSVAQPDVLPPLNSADKLTREATVDSLSADIRPLGQLNESFIIATDNQGLLLIDQHVAHERVLFDKYRALESNRQSESQQLLIPETFDLTPAQVAVFDDITAELEHYGFELMRLSGRTVAIKATPADLPAGEARNMLAELLDTVDGEKKGSARETLRDEIAASLACHAAIKVKMVLTPEKMRWLIDRLLKTSSPTTCPHGRPVILRLATRDILKGFHRI